MSRRRPKAKDQAKHARRKFMTRFGIRLTNEMVTDMVGQIQNGHATLVERQSVRVGVWEVKCKGKTVKIVYDSMRKTIVTVFPENSTWFTKGVFGIGE